MKIVIDIDDSYKEYIDKIPYIFNYLRAGTDFHKHILKALQNGTPLPKGHGRLIDADERRTEIDEEDRWVVDLAETIIEADKESD